MNFSFRYRRIGAFMIDLAIIKMFAQIIVDIYFGVVAYLGKGAGVSLSLHDSIALPMLLLLLITVMLVFIGTYVGYHWMCYKLLGNSLSRYFLRLKVEMTDGSPMTASCYLKREFEKAVLCIATVGGYLFFSGAQFVAFGYPPLHEKRSNTMVVES